MEINNHSWFEEKGSIPSIISEECILQRLLISNRLCYQKTWLCFQFLLTFIWDWFKTPFWKTPCIFGPLNTLKLYLELSLWEIILILDSSWGSGRSCWGQDMRTETQSSKGFFICDIGRRAFLTSVWEKRWEDSEVGLVSRELKCQQGDQCHRSERNLKR